MFNQIRPSISKSPLRYEDSKISTTNIFDDCDIPPNALDLSQRVELLALSSELSTFSPLSKNPPSGLPFPPNPPFSFKAIGVPGYIAPEDASWNGQEHELKLKMTTQGQRTDATAFEEGLYVEFSDYELRNMELFIDPNGLATIGDQVLGSEEHHNFLFFMRCDGRIFLTPDTEAPGIYHSSLSGGYWPLAAGKMRCIMGKIIKINEDSGHYKPSNRLDFVAEALTLKGYTSPHNIFKEMLFFGSAGVSRIRDTNSPIERNCELESINRRRSIDSSSSPAASESPASSAASESPASSAAS
ncbi:MAG: hypothetical protein ACI9S8_003015, partial [Chlamydiales bacterium]